MNDIEDYHGDKDQQCIENVQVDFMMQKIPIISLNIFSQSKDRANHDQEAHRIENIEVFPPRDIWGEGAWNGISFELQIKQGGGNDEKPEKENLDKETHDDDVFPGLEIVDAAAALYAAT